MLSEKGIHQNSMNRIGEQTHIIEKWQGEKAGTEGIYFKFRTWKQRTKTESETDKNLQLDREKADILTVTFLTTSVAS